MSNQKNNIPETGNTYIKYRFRTEACILIYKKIGFTPLQVLEEIKPYIEEEYQNKLTFVGRLDPMAEGYIHILWSGNKEEKEKLASQDKEYVVDVLLGIKTDTDDILGLIDSVNKEESFNKDVLLKFVGPFEYDYPKYSSPHIKKVLKGEEIEGRKQKGFIYDIEFLGLENINNEDLKKIVSKKLSLCSMKGDFRLEKVRLGWNSFFENNIETFDVIKLKVKCKSGTYMRVLARELGGLALGIARESLD